ncbi:MAG: serine/threonine-protein kinase [Myxococcota bacterium]
MPASERAASGRSDDTSAPPGGRLGRYIVLSKLGAGAMGVVFSAHDPELDRKVAIKLLKPGDWDEEGARRRLQREAQALARLAHRNVVAVYDVGVHDRQLFLAMEFVSGQTIGQWMQSVEQPRPWRAVVAVFMQAGAGLAAAHGAGLIHRDFKPDNGMIDEHGQVRVMDFGLARASVTDSSGDDAPGVESSAPDTRALASELTQSGALLGTPAYMAAEQLNRKPADARSDQFSFCVALYEALYGERPFGSTTLVELILAVNQGEVRPPPAGTNVPTWLRRVVVRGLAPNPDERHASMQALLDALAADPAAKWRRRIVGGALGLSALGVVWAVAFAVQTPTVEPCTGLDDNLEGVWDDDRRASVERALLATELSYAPSTWVRVQSGLDGYAGEWVVARTEACRATHRGEQSAELLDLRMACLNERLQYLSTTTDVLAGADTVVVDNAIVAVSNLPALERCADIDALKAKRPPPEDPDQAQRVLALDARLAKASALRDAAKYDASLEAAAAIVAEASDVDFAPLQARAALLLGEVQVQRSDYDAAADTLAKAYDLALSERMFEEAASASALLMHMFGYYLDQHEQGRIWAVQAGPLSRAVGTDEAGALFLNNRGAMTLAAGRPELARKDHEEALALRRAALGPDHPDVAVSLTHLGNVSRDLGQGAEALEFYRRALSIRQRVFGDGHPMVGASLYNLGSAARTMGQLGHARAWLEEALAIRRAGLGPSHPYVASTLYQLGSVARLAGEHERSRERHEEAFSIWSETLGKNHPDVAWGYSDLGLGASARGDLEAAEAHHRRALQIRQQSLGEAHPLVAGSLNALGTVAQARGEWTEARGLHERALVVGEQSESPASSAESLLGLGRVAFAEGDRDAAISDLERALGFVETGAVSPASADEIRLALARALWRDAPQGGRDRVRARTLVEAATFEHGEQATKRRAERDAWLSAQAGATAP